MNTRKCDSELVSKTEWDIPGLSGEQVPYRGAVVRFIVVIAFLLPAVPVLCRDGAEFRIDRAIGLAGAVMAIASLVSIRLEGLSLGKVFAVVFGALALLFTLAIDALFHFAFPPIGAAG